MFHLHHQMIYFFVRVPFTVINITCLLIKDTSLKTMLSNKEQQYIPCTSFQEKFYDIVFTPSNHNIQLSLNGIELFWDNSKSLPNILHKRPPYNHKSCQKKVYFSHYSPLSSSCHQTNFWPHLRHYFNTIKVFLPHICLTVPTLHMNSLQHILRN